MKRQITVLVLLAGVFAGGCGMAIVPNPDYAGWAGLQPGSYVTFEGTETLTTQMPGPLGEKGETVTTVRNLRITETMKAITPNEVTLERTETELLADGQELELPASERIEKADIFAADNPLTDPASVHETAEELQAVVVNNQTLMCEKIDTTLDVQFPIIDLLVNQGGVRITRYTNAEVPGGFVKAHMEHYNNHSTRVIEGQVVDFEAIRE
jgi:hypothetical protein